MTAEQKALHPPSVMMGLRMLTTWKSLPAWHPAMQSRKRGLRETQMQRDAGAALFAVLAFSYLAAIAMSATWFHGQPFIGGIGALVAIALGRIASAWTERKDNRGAAKRRSVGDRMNGET